MSTQIVPLDNMENEDLNPVLRQRRKSESKQDGSSASSSTETNSILASITQLPWKSASGENFLEISMPSQTTPKQTAINDTVHADENVDIMAFDEDSSSSSRRTNPQLRRRRSSKISGSSSYNNLQDASNRSVASFSIGGQQPPQSDASQKLLSGDLVQKDESRIQKIIVRTISSVLMVIEHPGGCVVSVVLILGTSRLLAF